MTQELENLLSLLDSPDEANFKLGLLIAKNYKEDFKNNDISLQKYIDYHYFSKQHTWDNSFYICYTKFEINYFKHKDFDWFFKVVSYLSEYIKEYHKPECCRSYYGTMMEIKRYIQLGKTPRKYSFVGNKKFICDIVKNWQVIKHLKTA